MRKVLITGSRGLIGRHLYRKLKDLGYKLYGIDIADGSGDIRNLFHLREVMSGCHGVIHLAALSRVAWAQKNPDLCWRTNAIASHDLLQTAIHGNPIPWVIVASSREVYGESNQIPLNENSPLRPINIYGRAKVSMEMSALNARKFGVNTAIVRLSNVYGCPYDHEDRVIPAFCKNALRDQPLRVDGSDNCFDFTHVSDVVSGFTKLVKLIDRGECDIPPIQLVSGLGTTLRQAAEIAIKSAKSSSVIQEAPSRKYDVHRFIGSHGLAKQILDWKPEIFPVVGIKRLIFDYAELYSVKTASLK